MNTFLTIYIIYLLVVFISMLLTIDEDDKYIDFITYFVVFNIPLYGQYIYFGTLLIVILDKFNIRLIKLEENIIASLDYFKKILHSDIKKKKK